MVYDKILTGPSLTTFVLHKHSVEQIFANALKGCHFLDVNHSGIKTFSPMRADGEIGENFLFAKLFVCMEMVWTASDSKPAKQQ